MKSVVVRPLAFAAVAAFVPPLSRGIGILAGLPFLEGFYFGALLAGYLWFCYGVHAPGRLLGLVAVSGAAFKLAVFSAIALQAAPTPFGWLDSGNSGPGPMPFFVAGILGASILSSTFLVLLPRRSSSEEMLRRVGICAGAGGALGLVGAIVTEEMRMVSSYLPLFMVWQPGMAFVMAIIAELSADGNEVQKNGKTVPAPLASDSLSGASLAFFRAMLVLSVLVFGWELGRRAEAETFKEEEARKHAVWLAQAPSRENLPPLRQQPLDTMFVSRIASMRMEGEGSVRLEQAPPGVSPGHARPPDYLVYYASYTSNTASMSNNPSITIWQYPTSAWARYEARYLVGVAVGAVGDQHVLDDGGLENYWFSEDKMIRITGQQAELNALLAAYLPKYPSGVDAAFPLFNPARPH